MLDSLFKTIHSVLVESNSKRALSVFVLILVVLSSGLLLEWYTNYLELTRLEHSVQVLEKLQSLKLSSDKELRQINASIVTQLKHVARPRGIPTVVYGVMPTRAWLWKGLAGAAPIVLLTILTAIRTRHKPDVIKQGLAGLMLWAATAGLLGAALPAFFWPWGNLVAYPIISCIAIIVAIVSMSDDSPADVPAA